MATLNEQIRDRLDSGQAGDGLAVQALLTVNERHWPEQHYTIGQDNKRTPSRLYCRTCRATSPCVELKVVAKALRIDPEPDSVRDMVDRMRYNAATEG